MAKREFRLDIPEESYQVLEGNAREMGVTVSEAVRRALNIETFLVEQKRQGKRVLVENGNGKFQNLVVA